jgi:hypothetical protein
MLSTQTIIIGHCGRINVFGALYVLQLQNVFRVESLSVRTGGGAAQILRLVPSCLSIRMLTAIQANLQRGAGRKGMLARFVGMTFLTH